MDADTRHQLKQNELAVALGQLRKLGDVRTRYWLIAIVVVVAAILVYRYSRAQQAQTVVQEWARLAAIDPMAMTQDSAPLDELRSLISQSSNPGFAAVARLQLTWALRQQAQADPERAETLLREAANELKLVADAPDTAAPLAAAAHYALGSVYESLGEFDQAKTTYETLITNNRYVGSPFPAMASERIEGVDALRVRVTFEPGDPPPPPLPEVEPPLPVTTQPTSAPAEPGEGADAEAGAAAPASRPASEASAAEQP
ncbi:MAG: hypothetical protein KKB50_13970 [Planctomycetes bacterium]|nr:hypothetical protein [Planctomycetota bacterium]